MKNTALKLVCAVMFLWASWNTSLQADILWCSDPEQAFRCNDQVTAEVGNVPNFTQFTGQTWQVASWVYLSECGGPGWFTVKAFGCWYADPADGTPVWMVLYYDMCVEEIEDCHILAA